MSSFYGPVDNGHGCSHFVLFMNMFLTDGRQYLGSVLGLLPAFFTKNQVAQCCGDTNAVNQCDTSEGEFCMKGINEACGKRANDAAQ